MVKIWKLQERQEVIPLPRSLTSSEVENTLIGPFRLAATRLALSPAESQTTRCGLGRPFMSPGGHEDGRKT
jgi:hypothetical protein